MLYFRLSTHSLYSALWAVMCCSIDWFSLSKEKKNWRSWEESTLWVYTHSDTNVTAWLFQSNYSRLEPRVCDITTVSFRTGSNMKQDTAKCETGPKSNQNMVCYPITMFPLWWLILTLLSLKIYTYTFFYFGRKWL